MSNTADKVQKTRKLAGRIEVTSLFSEDSDYKVVRRGELEGAKGFDQIQLKNLNLTETGGKGKYIRVMGQEDGQVSATDESFDTAIPESNASNINAPTTAAVKTYVDNSIGDLYVSSVGQNGSYLKTISETDGKISATTGNFDTAVPVVVIDDIDNIPEASNITAPTTRAVADAVNDIWATLDELEYSEEGSQSKTLTYIQQTDGQIEVAFEDIQVESNQITDKQDTYTATSDKVVTGKALRDAIETLYITNITNSAGKTVSKVTEADGKVGVEFQDISITSSQVSDLNTTISNAINNLDVGETGENGKYIKKIEQANGKILTTLQAFDTSITATDNNAPTSNAVKTYVDNHASNTNGHANATTTANGFMSATDKSNLDTLVASFKNDDANTTIDSIKEVLKAFENAPEATNIVNALAGKSDTTHVHGNITTDGKLGTASRVVVTDDSKNITVSSSITTTELDYLDGVTSKIQDQLNSKVDENAAITGATKCKITYDSKGLVTSGADLSASDIPSLATSKINSGTFADERIASAAAWNAKYDKPATGIPASDLVDLASNKITSMTSYTKASSVSAITTSDSLNSAIGKLEKALDGKAATEHGTHVTTATVKEALGTGTGTSKYLREDGTWVTPPNDNNTYKIIVSNTSTSSSDSHVANNTNGNSYIILHDTSINSAAASLNIAGYDGISVTNTNTGVIKFTGNAATNSTYGVVKSAANRTEAPTLITGENATGRFYGVELDSNGKMFVNVPWTDSSLGTGHTHATTVEKLESEDDSAIKLQFGKSYALTAGGEICNFTIDSYTVTAAAEGGHDVSLVTTGEKYIWNNKQDAISDLATIRSDASTGATHATSTHARTDATKVEASATNGNIKIDDSEVTVYTHPTGTNPHGTTASDVGLGNVGNFKAVSTVASQGLTDAEKSNARANIGAFEGYTSSNKLAANLVSEDTSHRFVTDAEKETWNTTLKGKIEGGVLTITNM